MPAIKQEDSTVRPRAGRCFVSVGPAGLVVSTGRRAKGGAQGGSGSGQAGTPVVTIKDRISGLAVTLNREQALELAASLQRADRFLGEEAASAQPLDFQKTALKKA
jgi:hypothetical protein